MKFEFSPIGYISSPYSEECKAPPQGFYDNEIKGAILLDERFIEGARDIKAGLKYTVIFVFHKAKDYELITDSRMNGKPQGVFSTRSPSRPNRIGVSVINVTAVNGGVIEFTGVDMFDGTPVLDIKPFISMEETHE